MFFEQGALGAPWGETGARSAPYELLDKLRDLGALRSEDRLLFFGCGPAAL